MKKIFVAVSIFMFGLSACSQKGEHIEPLSKEDASHVLGYYYQQPDSEKLVRTLAYLDESNILKKDKTVSAPVLGFLSGLAITDSPEWNTVSQEIVWEKNMRPIMSDMPKRIALLQRMVANNDMVVADAAALDFLWGAFASTGDPRFVQVIIRTKNSLEVNPIVRWSAAWSLYAQSKQHPIVEKELKKSPAPSDEFMQKLETKLQSSYQ